MIDYCCGIKKPSAEAKGFNIKKQLKHRRSFD
jgi:hypothetical protein